MTGQLGTSSSARHLHRTGPARKRGSAVLRLCAATTAIGLLAACEGGLDLDLRGQVGDNFTTADAARQATAKRPKPDDRGIISYPNYQVAVARRGDTLLDVANRIDVPVAELARFNGIKADDKLRRGEIIALPGRVEEPSPETGADGTGPILPPDKVDVTELASNAIENSDPTPVDRGTTGAKPQTGLEPVRHKVARGETAYTLARLYNVTVRSLADWNGLDRNYTLREGQFLLIPTALAAETTGKTTAADRDSREEDVTEPGTGSPTPIPPSASKPLPENDTEAVSTTETTTTPEPTPAPTPAPKLETTEKASDGGKMGYPVNGSIIREYKKGSNDGIDITASAGTPIRAAASGVVAAITSDADNIPIIVIKHPDNLLTVYANVGDISVKKDDRVSRGQSIGKMRAGSPPYVHFEVRRGFDSVDPLPFLQ